MPKKSLSRRQFLAQAAMAAGGAALTASAAKAQRAVRAEGMPTSNYEDIVRQPVANLRLDARWLDGGARFWYARDAENGAREFVMVASETGAKSPAFDHATLAAALTKATGKPTDATHLPLTDLEFDGPIVQFTAFDARWKYVGDALTKLADVKPETTAAPPPGPRRRRAQTDEIAFIRDYNVWTRDPNGRNPRPISKDGTRENPYAGASASPNGKTIAAFRVTPVKIAAVYAVEGAPKDGSMRGELHSHEYAQPGDPFPAFEAVSFDASNGAMTPVKIPPTNFGEGAPDVHWAKDSRHFFLERTERGHQRFRLLSVDSQTGDTSAIIDETTSTFINTSNSFTRYLPETDEVIYVSERDGWRHLYLYDTAKCQLKNQITKGDWVVREVGEIDAQNRQIWFQASGFFPGQDPYNLHFFRVDFDGSHLTPLTDSDGTHSLQISPDKRFAVATFSRPDLPPVHELRRLTDGKKVANLEKSDISNLTKNGWRAPEVFAAKGRDGKTEIWGNVFRPTHFDAAKKYPVIENIYAGPQDSFTRKTFAVRDAMQSLAELGFVVIQCDGMGTRNRSKAFHDVCWRNLKDAGLPDRIAWMTALAKKDAACDTTRVGIYGTSAGGQSSTGALLFHPDFYKVGVSSCGCHDNRVDKRWWNEQWMGFPVGEWYADSSNVVHAENLRGKLLLIVGELDTNVPPESTLRVADALIKAGKDFDYLVMPGLDHTSGGAYGERRRRDYFVRHLLGIEPPDRNAPAPPAMPVLLTPRPPSNASNASAEAGEGTTVTFKNLTRQAVTLFWVHDGTRTSYPTIAPGASHTQNTYAGHVWLAVGADGRELAVFVGEAKPGIAEIR